MSLKQLASWKSYAFYSWFPGSYDYTLSSWNVEALVEWLVPWVLFLKAGWDFRKVTIRLKANLILVLKAIYSQGLMALFAWATQNTRYMTISGRFSRNVVATHCCYLRGKPTSSKHHNNDDEHADHFPFCNQLSTLLFFHQMIAWSLFKP